MSIADAMRAGAGAQQSVERPTWDAKIRAQAAQEAARGADQTKPTPEEQADYDKAMTAVMTVLYQEPTHGQLMQTLQSGKDDPANAIAQTTFLVVTQIDDQAQGGLPEAILMGVAEETLSLVAELAAKVMPVDEATTQKAAQRLVILLAKEYGADPQEIQGLIQSVGMDRAKQMATQQAKIEQGGGTA